MSVAVNNPWRAVRDDVETAAQDESLNADARVARLRLFRDDAVDLLGRIDTYIGDLELVREGRDPAFREVMLEAREEATLREQLIERGIATPDEMDVLGYLTHEDLDRLTEERLLDEWLAPRLAQTRGISEASLGEMIDRLWSEAKHPRGSGGKFRDVLGRNVTPRGRHGRAVPGGGGGAARTAAGAAEHSDFSGVPQPHHPATRVSTAEPGAEQVQSDIARAAEVGLNDWPTKGDKATELLGDAADTREAHTVVLRGQGGTRVYTPERKQLHDKIIDTLLRERMPVRNSQGEIELHPNPDGEPLKPPEGAAPRVLFMGGGTASGKSTALGLDENQGVTPEGAAHIDPDEIKAMIPEYVQMVQAGDKYAANGVHEESSDISKRLLAEAMKRGLNIVRDGTGNSKLGKFSGQISDMHNAGYDVHAFYVNAPTEVALVRAATRAQRTGRWVPEPEVRSQHKMVSDAFVQTIRPLVENGTVSSISMWHTEGTPTKFAEGGGGAFHVLDQGLYDGFANKAKEGA